MKLTKYFLTLAGIALLASCSNDKVLDQSGVNPLNNGEAFVSIAITVPAGTRVDTEQDANGESNILNGRILLFRKLGSELTSTFLKSASLEDVANSSNWTTKKENGIEQTSKTVTARFEDLPEDVDFYGLVILNATDEFTDPSYGQTFESWSTTALNNMAYDYTVAVKTSTDSKKGYTMTNAPVWANNNVTSLVSLSKSNFKDNKEDAEKSPVTFYVQRVVAKVRLDSQFPSSIDVKGFYGETNGDKVSMTKWGLDITNKSTFPVQVVDKLSSYFTTSHFYQEFGTNLYGRFYWAIDPNYGSGSSSDFNLASSDNDLGDVTASSTIYCLENTFDHENQNQNVSTRVIFKGSYIVKGEEEAVSFFRIGNTLYTETLLNEQISLEDEKTISFVSELPDGGKEVKLSDIIDNSDEKSLEAVKDYLGITDKDAEVSFYKNGECYYTAVIRHFTDEDTKWSEYEDIFKTKGEYTDEQLGRFGVLRNNIYNIAINSVTGPGLPAFPDAPDDENPEPNDSMTKEYYISLDINVMQWAVRTHSYDLK